MTCSKKLAPFSMSVAYTENSMELASMPFGERLPPSLHIAANFRFILSTPLLSMGMPSFPR